MAYCVPIPTALVPRRDDRLRKPSGHGDRLVPSDAPTAFFSYCRTDSDFALKLAEDLKAAGAHVWMDQLDIDPGQEWDSAVEQAVTRSPRMLLILSPASVQSKNVRNEIAFALDEQKTIIPVLYQDCAVPLQLRRIQHIDFRTDYARGLGRLLKTLAVEQPAAASVTVPAAAPLTTSPTVEDAEEHAAAQAEREEQEQDAAEGKTQQEEQERQRIAAEQAKLEEVRRKAAAEQARLQQEERERKATEERARQDEQERQRLTAELAKQEEEERKAAAEKARHEEEERQQKAAEEKARLDALQRQRVIAEAARIVEERHQSGPSHSGVQAAAASAHLTRKDPRRTPQQDDEALSKAPTDDEIDALWAAERQKRQKELTKAIVEEWSAHGEVSGEREESEAVSKLRSALNDWLAERPPGFESREAKRQERQEAETKKALENWRLRK